MANIQTRLKVNRPGDRFEAEADRAAAAVVSHIEGRSNGNSQSANVEVSRLQNGTGINRRQCCEEEEMQTKLQRQPSEEEEELQMKLQRQPIEEEEEMQTKLQRQTEEEEEMQMKPESASASNHGNNSTNHVESRIAQRRGQGKSMAGAVKEEMESGFGADFSKVRVHHDAEASQISSGLNAQAFTTGNDIYFNQGKYQPDSKGGKKLLAHELTHVIQQNGGAQGISRKAAAGEQVEEEPVKDASGSTPQDKHISGKAETEIQREIGDIPDAGPADAGPSVDTTDAGPVGDGGNSGDPTPTDEDGEPPQPAAPTLRLSPGNTLTRGENFKATIIFQPNGDESYRVTSWRYTTAEHGNVDRPSSDAEFQNKWDGTMAVSGTLEMTYRITPEGGTEGPEQTLSEEITVEDRTGDEWESEVDEQPETPYNGSPSPPTVFSHLGHHEANVTNPDPDLETISSGPNKDLRFVNTLTAGTYSSAAQIHPDLLNSTSDFYTFHLNAGILYIVEGDTQTEVPRSEYSSLVIGENSISFDVPDWETFYKSHDIVRVVAYNEDESDSFVVPESAWELDDNDEDAGVNITNETAVRNGLGIGQNDGFSFRMEFQKSYEATKLMQAPAILAGTRSHEYTHGTHSHRANFLKMMRAIDPEKKIENKVSSAQNSVNFNSLLREWRDEILEPNHEIVDETASEEQEEFVAIGGETMAGINTNPDTGDNLGAVWNISANTAMGN